MIHQPVDRSDHLSIELDRNRRQFSTIVFRSAWHRSDLYVRAMMITHERGFGGMGDIRWLIAIRFTQLSTSRYIRYLRGLELVCGGSALSLCFYWLGTSAWPTRSWIPA